MIKEDAPRSQRRHDTERLKKTRRFFGGAGELPDDPKRIGKIVTTPTTGKDQAHANPRHLLNEDTVQEKSAKESFKKIDLIQLQSI